MKSDWSMDPPVTFKDGRPCRKESPEQQDRADSPEPSCVSMKSDWSMDPPVTFKDGQPCRKERRVQPERADSPGPSSVSMKSDWSMDPPVTFKDGRPCRNERRHHQDRADSPGPSCAPVKRDQSMDPLLKFDDGNQSTEKRRVQHVIADSPGPSCVSGKSDQSMDPPLKFKDGNQSTEKRRVQHERADSPGPSVPMERDCSMDYPFNLNDGNPQPVKKRKVKHEDTDSAGSNWVSMKSDWSMDPPDQFKDKIGEERKQQERSKISRAQIELIKRAEENAHAFLKKELKKLWRVLLPDYPQYSDSEWEEEEVDGKNKEQRRRAIEGVVDITKHCLMEMNEEELADKLRSGSRSHDQPLQPHPTTKTVAVECQHKFMAHLKRKFRSVFEGIAKAGQSIRLNNIYTELFIRERGTGEVNQEHEVRWIETASRKPAKEENPIKCEDILKPLPGQDQPIRTIMTTGVAGIGKTFLTHKFTLDWAEGKTNHNINFTFPITFRELNLLKGKEFSLVGLLHHFFIETKEASNCRYDQYQVVFILDGLDECRLPLDFQNNQIWTDVTKSASVDVLLTNLIRGDLLPSAHIWITTRPAAANQIPAECVDRVTEVRGFTNAQKEEYFRKRFSEDEKLANTIIDHVKTSRSLHIMCHIPIFCWISANVLKYFTGKEMPKTLTQMYSHFLRVQSIQGDMKYHGRTETDQQWSSESRKIIVSLGKLAFNQLKIGNLIFYEEDLAECGIDIKAASVYSGVFTQIFKEECGLYQDKVFCFVHLSIQEFLAALHVFLSFIDTGVNLLSEEQPTSMEDELLLYKSAVDKALQSENGHLDLFLRFLLGLSLETNQKLLRGLLAERKKGSSSRINHGTVRYIREKMRGDLSPESSINLFHCLNELNCRSLVEKIHQSLTSGSLSGESLSPAHFSALVFILQSSEEGLDVFDLKKYPASDAGLLKLLPVFKDSKTFLLNGCGLSEECCEALASVLSSDTSSLRELDLSTNDLKDSGVKLLSAVLGSHCTLETLRLTGCHLSEECCEALASVLSSNTSSLRELDLSINDLLDSGVKLLSVGLGDPRCTLKSLRLNGCGLSERCCEALASVLSSNSSSLRELDLSTNDLKDSGVKLLSVGLGSQNCTLETLRLSGCLVTQEGCASLASALSSNPSHLRELDLSYNHPGDSGAALLSAGLEDPRWRLDTLSVEHRGVRRLKPALKKYACKLTLDPNTANKRLSLSEELRKVTEVEEKQKYADHPEKFDSYSKVLCRQGLTGRCYWEVEWKGEVSIGVTYRRITRRGDDGKLGRNNKSWSLEFHDDHYSAQHSDKDSDMPTPSGSDDEEDVDDEDDDDDDDDDDGNQDYGGDDDDGYGVDYSDGDDMLDDDGYDKSGYDDFDSDKDYDVDDNGDDDFGDEDQYGVDDDDYDEDDYYGKIAIERYFAWCNGRATVISLPITSYDDDNDIFSGDEDDISGDPDVADFSSARHNSSTGSNRVGVYLDMPAGTLSFYRVSASDTLTHIHTFQSTFNQELQPGFGFELKGSGSTVSLCRL
ncbi:NLR family CARD domain-containing protein 3-like isoform X4 [Gadus macrocephalus]|uniref:NLR family CARD domain-containing protein 3-like isoform X4 n=1 Tax=Gadus macrocephalus TaxID=80720 RepID=UPI0028CB3542|nr:NLR family CARD domain-containing protein 3-like isoform X4 [Gadus macrocephalus]